MNQARDSDRDAESRRILDRISKEVDSSGSALGQPPRHGPEGPPKSHEPVDRIEQLGMRIGRVLGMVLFAVLVFLLLRLVISGD